MSTTPSLEADGGEKKLQEFHRSRRMFCIKGGKLHIAPVGVAFSHLEWFRREGWVTSGEDNEERFFKHIVRGYYVPQDNAIYCFRETEFLIDPGISSTNETDVSVELDILDAIIHALPHLKEALELKNDTRIFIGPKNIDAPDENVEPKLVATVATVIQNYQKSRRKTDIQYGNKD